MMKSILALLLGCVFVHSRDDYTDEAMADQITSLPGLSPSILKNYNMFSGYIDVFSPHNRSIFYWFVESLHNPSSDPVSIWTNGGPGCSGLGGFFTEQGPFRPNETLSLYVNEYSWVNAASMVFIETPAGVGFSYSDDIDDYSTGDTQTALDNYHFIQGWLRKFPNYQSNDFYISSESYGGHYMPTLAQQIILGNAAGGSPQVNFKGVFLGNPYTDPVENAKGRYDTWYGHQLVSRPTWQSWYSACGDGADTGSSACARAEIEMNLEVGNIDPYALDYPVCLSSVALSERFWFLKEVVKGAMGRPLPPLYEEILSIFEKHQKDGKDDSEILNSMAEGYYPCESNWMTQYLNQKSVQKAIHAVLKNKNSWSMCGGINYDHSSTLVPMEPTWQWIIANDPSLHITIVSGDDDSVCGSLGTQSWIYDMGYPISQAWTEWVDSNGQTAGYVVKFENAFNFVTVHSAGHLIPETQPMRSLETFRMFLKGQI